MKRLIGTIVKSKTDVFLLAYTLFLICSIFLYPIWEKSFANKMIAAISISGALFSFAELCYTIRSLKNDKIQQSCELLRLSIKAMNDLLAERKRMIDQMTNSANFQYVLSKGPAEKEDPILVKSQSQQKEVIAIEMAKYEDDYAKTQKTITNIQKGIDSMKSKISETSIAGNVLMVLGILLFLIIITLNSFTFVESLSPYLTITAFALLMINYLVKQFYITNMKIDIEALREKYDK